MNVKRWLCAVVSCLMLTRAVMQMCIPMTSVTSSNAALSGAQNRLAKVNTSVTEVEEQLLDISNYSPTRLDLFHKKRSYRISGANRECTSSVQTTCRRCTDGTVVLQCVDGVGRRHLLQECQHQLRPPVINSLTLTTQNETAETYTLPRAESCCATSRSLDLCTCVQNFANGSDCTQCIPEHFGLDCMACPCSSHGVCFDGRLRNGSCVCNDGWGDVDCSKELRYTIVQKLLAPDGAADDQLGDGGASLSADGSVLVATSWGDDDLGTNSGSVYVWHWNGSSYAYVQKLLTPDGIASDELGRGGVSLSSDGYVLAAASHGDDDGYTDRGSVHVWCWNGTMFTYVQKLLAPDGAANDYFGFGGVSLSLDGTLLVTASPYDDDLGSASGSVYVWLWNESFYTYIQKLLAPDGATSDSLGYGRVSVSSDGSFLAAASYQDDELGTYSGSVDVWRWNGTLFEHTQKLLAPDGAENDHLGTSGVRLSGDGSLLAAASYWDDDVGINSGSLYVWRWNGSLFEHTQKLLAPDGAAYDAFGFGLVSLSEDGSYLAATSHADDDMGETSGSVYVWHWNGAYEYVQKLLAPDGVAGDVLGFGGVSLSWDGSFLVTASPRDDDAYSNSGSVYVALLGWIDDSISEKCVKTRSNVSTCICAFPFTGETCEECLSNYFGNDCTQCTCSSHGVCMVGRYGNGTCTCDSHWTGPTCSECWTNYYGSECDPCDCGMHGSCSDGVSGTGNCVCDEGWTGAVCDTCNSNFYGVNCTACLCEHGVCLDGLEGQGCVCDDGWSGVHCATCDKFRIGANCSTPLQYFPVQKLLAPDGASIDQLGSGGVSLSSDGRVLSAASHGGDDLGSDSGCLYVWRWNGTLYSFVQKLLAPDSASGDSLGGGGVRLSSDGSVLSAASLGDDDLGDASGSLYVWRWNGTLYAFVQKLLAPDGASNDYLGYGGVSLSSDGSVLSAASPCHDDLGSNSGSLYVWRWNGIVYTFVQKLFAPDGASGDLLGGGGVSLSSDGSVLSAASQGDDDLGSASGSLYVWRWNGTLYSFVQKLLAPDGAGGDYLGRGGVSVSSDGRVLSAASYRDDDLGTDSGSLYVWVWNGTLYTFVQKLFAPDGAYSDYLGFGGVSLSSDGSLLSAASRYDNDLGTDSGSLYVWVWNGTSYTFVQKLLAPDGASYDYLGAGGVSLSSDGRVLSAASYGDDDVYTDSGSVYVFHLGWIDTSVSDQCMKQSINSSTCMCTFPYSGDTCEECLANYFGSDCTQCACSSHGVCADGRLGDGTCTCDSHWTGSKCSECLTNHYGSECDACLIECGVHGRCFDGVSGTGDCVCDEGWTGTACDVCDSNYYGAHCTACLCEHGTCLDSLIGNGSCVCDEGWKATLCNECASGYYGSNCTLCPSCGVHGTCDDGQAGSGLCICEVGWNGTLYNECALGWNGTLCNECALGWNGTLCNQCASGYYGSVCLACPHCSDHGVCNDGLTGIGCVCSNGFLRTTSDMQKLLAPDGAAYDRLGYGGVSLSGDGNVLVAGAYGDDDNGDDSGSVHVWRWNSSSHQFVYVQKLLAPDGAAYDWLGFGGPSLSLNGSLLVAGAPDDDDKGSQSGSLYVWRWNLIAQQFDYLQKFLAPEGDTGDYLGQGGTSLSGDGSVLAAGAPNDDDNGNLSGSVYVWRWNSANEQFIYVQKLLAPDGAVHDYLGLNGVSLSADGNVLAAGAHGNDEHGDEAGSLYVWRWDMNTQQFVFVQKLLAPDGAAGDYFGHGGASLNGNGSMLVTGAYKDNDNGLESGSLYVWRWNTTSDQFVYVQKVLAPDGSAYDYLGHGGAALSADGTMLSAGADGNDENGTNSGCLYLWRWDLNTQQFVYLQKLLAPDGAPGDWLSSRGVSLSVNSSMLSAGAGGDDDNGDNSGSVYVWYLK